MKVTALNGFTFYIRLFLYVYLRLGVSNSCLLWLQLAQYLGNKNAERSMESDQYTSLKEKSMTTIPSDSVSDDVMMHSVSAVAVVKREGE